MTRYGWWVSGLALLSLACSGETVSPTNLGSPSALQLPESELHFLQTAAGAPSLAQTTASFWAVKGQTREAEILYQDVPGAPVPNRLVRFRVNKNSLVNRPDGTPIAPGDSILITMTVVDTIRMIVDFQPAGLVFSTKKPGKITLWYLEADHDFNHDGVIDAADSVIESTFQVWGQEQPGDPWSELVSAPQPGNDQVEADIPGFTRYAVSY